MLFYIFTGACTYLIKYMFSVHLLYVYFYSPDAPLPTTDAPLPTTDAPLPTTNAPLPTTTVFTPATTKPSFPLTNTAATTQFQTIDEG